MNIYVKKKTSTVCEIPMTSELIHYFEVTEKVVHSGEHDLFTCTCFLSSPHKLSTRRKEYSVGAKQRRRHLF